MTNLVCIHCGNDKTWDTIEKGPGGYKAKCAECGKTTTGKGGVQIETLTGIATFDFRNKR